ncbi:MAG: HAMP domain-containing protein [Lachnospiraceae bacterium]|nr:HAMP domain-containing protein [Lachnospiraceae bacterium]
MIKRHLFWRIYLYFGIVLVVVLASVGLVFTNLNRNNIMEVYEEQIYTLATNISKQVRTNVMQNNPDGFISYLTAIEDFGEMQSADIWIISTPDSEYSMPKDFANVDIESVNVPDETEEILQKAYQGDIGVYNNYDSIYEKTILHLAQPIKNTSGHVMGVVLINATVEVQEYYVSQYQKFMGISILAGLAVAFLLAIFFSRQISGPIREMRRIAIAMAAGNYDIKTNVKRSDEIGQLAESLDILGDRLEAAEEMRENMEQNRRDFFSNVSHELRTPITVMKGYAETLADGYVKDEDKRRDYYDRMLSECTGMERLVSDLLILSKMQNPDFELDMELLNVIAVAQDTLRSLRVMMKEKNIETELSYNDECSLICGDYDRIRQLFLIILQNAMKYSEGGTKISVKIEKWGTQIFVSIEDEGMGIASEDLENIFEKFYRGKNHHEKDGSGLGLVVAKHIMERHGGSIHAESELGKGTTFIMEFPAEEPENQ